MPICQTSEKDKFLNLPGFSKCECYAALWKCHNIPWKSSEYISGSKCASILRQGSKYVRQQELHRVLNMPKYSWIYLNRTWICLNMSEFTIIDKVLNMSHVIHSARSLYKLMSNYWKMGESRTVKDLIWSVLEK